MNFQFWHHADKLVGSSQVVLVRSKGSKDEAGNVWPLDHGFLSEDGAIPSGLECWVGSAERTVTGAIMTVDPQKRESVVKLLIGCTKAEGESVLDFIQSGQQGAQLVWRS